MPDGRIHVPLLFPACVVLLRPQSSSKIPEMSCPPPFCVAQSVMLAGFTTPAPAVTHHIHLGTARTAMVNISFCSLSFLSPCLASKVQKNKKVQVSLVWYLLFLRCSFSDDDINKHFISGKRTACLNKGIEHLHTRFCK